MNIWFTYRLGKINNVSIKLINDQQTELEAILEAIKELQREAIKRETSPKSSNNW